MESPGRSGRALVFQPSVIARSLNDKRRTPRTAFSGSRIDWHRQWPAWVTSLDNSSIGSRWKLMRPATIVLPEHCGYPTLALVDDVERAGRCGL